MVIILFGPPGAGKGTQGDLLAASAGLRKLSTGDLIRDAMRAGTPLGVEARRYYDAGELVPDDLIVGLVKQTILAEPAGGGFILDGFPRTIAQARALDVMLAEVGKPLRSVLVLDVNDGEIVKRLGGRRACPNCGAVYHDTFDPPGKPGVCDRCGHSLVQRTDDQPETVQKRLSVYRRETAPVLEYYRESVTPVHSIAGDRPIDVVQSELRQVLGL
jgi:adenylate kinase